MNKSRFLAIAILLLGVSIAFPMGGGGGGSQKTHRGFEGKITDGNGKDLKGAEIVLLPIDAAETEKVKDNGNGEGKKSLSTTSGSSGRFKFMAVRPGVYRVRFSMNGYQTIEKTMEIKRGTKDAFMKIELNQIVASAASGGQP